MGQGTSRFGGKKDACYICLEHRSPLLRPGCACRDLHAHVVCVMQYKAAKLEQDAPLSAMWTCETCRQEYSGTFRGVLAQTWHDTVVSDAQPQPRAPRAWTAGGRGAIIRNKKLAA